jgi:hypothetical protein
MDELKISEPQAALIAKLGNKPGVRGNQMIDRVISDLTDVKTMFPEMREEFVARYLSENSATLESQFSGSHYTLFNKTHRGSQPDPKGNGPNGGRLQSHHGLQQEWAEENLKGYKYDPELAPTVTLETGKGFPHTKISQLQNARRDARVRAGQGKWSSTLQQELEYIASDLSTAGFPDPVIKEVLQQQYKMLDKLGVPYTPIPGY